MPSSERKLSWTLLLYTAFPYLAFFITQVATAQTTTFNPEPDDINALRALVSQTESNYQQDLSALPSKYKKELKDVYKLRQDNIKERFDKKEIYTAASSTSYLEKIVQEIVNSNQLLTNEHFNCFFSKSGIPNAGYLGEKLILFNMGLFVKLDNESQLAFILCHEIAHCYLRHSENTIYRYVSTINSEAVQQELRAIKKSQYNKRTGLEKLLTGLTFNSRHHSRDHESQADSMAVALLKNTRFDISESLTTLALLDTIDTDTFNMEECLQKYFDAPEYPFKKRWLNREKGLLGGHAVLNDDPVMADSLKTHPDCAARIKYIQPFVIKYQSASLSKFLIDKDRFDDLKKRFQYEIVAYAFESDNYSRSLYYNLMLLDKIPGDPYLVTHTGNILNTFYYAGKKHTLGKVVDLPTPGFNSSYNILLQFINNVYLEDYAAISYHYLKKYQSVLQSYPPYLTAFNTSIEISK